MVFLNFRLRVKNFIAFDLRFDGSMPRSLLGKMFSQSDWNRKGFQGIICSKKCVFYPESGLVGFQWVFNSCLTGFPTKSL